MFVSVVTVHTNSAHKTQQSLTKKRGDPSWIFNPSIILFAQLAPRGIAASRTLRGDALTDVLGEHGVPEVRRPGRSCPWRASQRGERKTKTKISFFAPPK